MVIEFSGILAVIQQNNANFFVNCDRPLQLLGTSATLTTLASIYLALPRYRRDEVDGFFLSRQSVCQISQMLRDLDYESRAAIPCIGRDRADLIGFCYTESGKRVKKMMMTIF